MTITRISETKEKREGKKRKTLIKEKRTKVIGRNAVSGSSPLTWH